MTDMIRVKVEDQEFRMSRSLLLKHPKSRLTKDISKQLDSNPEGEVVLKGRGKFFKFVLEYLDDDGHVTLPINVSKFVFLVELCLYGIRGVDSSKIVCDFFYDSQSQKQVRVNSWDVHVAILTLAKKCAFSHIQSPGVLEINVEHDPSPDDTLTCPVELWKAFVGS